MKPRTLALLERLERRAVDEHRQELAEAEQRIQAASMALAGMRAARPIETAIAKLFIRLRKAAPSLCMSMNSSPIWPLSYSPVRR